MSFMNEKIEKVEMANVIQPAFLDYAMSVVIARAIPDVRDGLKPVHRRILYAMDDLGMYPERPFKKSARIVGEVIGKYHPHGDTAVYDTMVGMTQDWKMKETLVRGHGNFGDITGENAAAMRYTEAKLEKIAMELLKGMKDGQRNTNIVDFRDNYDATESEPSVLPALFPNLLVNGSQGIAVGLATKIPPHNLKEVIDATIATMKNPDITTDELLTHIKGPDFPTFGRIMGRAGIKEAYETGRGKVVMRGVVDVKKTKKKTTLLITEVPYQVNPSALIDKIGELQTSYNKHMKDSTGKKAKLEENKFIDFASGIKNLADRNNPVAIEIELKKDVEPEKVINFLYKHTALETNFNINMMCIVPHDTKTGTVLKPKVLPLKGILNEYIKHRRITHRRLLTYFLDKHQKRMHILSALITALDNLDETVRVIRASTSKQDAIDGLMNLLAVDKTQAETILEEKLQRLANFEIEKLRLDIKELASTITEIEQKLANETLFDADIIASFEEISEKYGSVRQTEICGPAEEFDMEDFIPDDEVVVTITQKGFVKRVLESSYRTQRRKGIGVKGMGLNDGDFIRHLHVARNHDTLLFFTNEGRVYRKQVWEIPETNAENKGKNIFFLLNLNAEERVQAVLSIREFSKEQHLFFVTKNGFAKKSKLSDYGNIRKNGIIALNLDRDDRLVGVSLTNGKRNVTLITKKAQCITIQETDVKNVGRTARGVRGIKLNKEDSVVSFAIHEEDADLLVATNNGYGKRTPLADLRVQNRYGKGVLIAKLNDKNGEIVGSCVVREEETLMMMTKNGTLMKMHVHEISQIGRNTQGTRIINLRSGDALSLLARIPDEEGETEEPTL